MKITMVMGKSSRSMGTFVSSLSQALREQGHEVSIIAEPTSAKRFRLNNVKPLWPVMPQKGYLLRSFWRRLWGVRAEFSQTDVIHAHGVCAAWFTLILNLLLARRVPILVSLYERHEKLRRGLGGYILQSWLLKRASLISGSSLSLTASINTRTAQIPGVDAVVSHLVSPRVESLTQLDLLDRQLRVQRWSALARQERLKNRGQLVLAVGDITAQKRYDRFVAAMQRVTYPATAVVIGEGDPQLLAQLRSLGADAQVTFLDRRTDLDAWLSAASVLVFTSEWEYLAFVAQEALALGVPVVAPPQGRLRDLMAGTDKQQDWKLPLLPNHSVNPLKAQGGLFIDPDNPEQTAQAITQLLSDPTIWYESQSAARQQALSWPTIGDMARQWIEYYQSALSHDLSASARLERSP